MDICCRFALLNFTLNLPSIPILSRPHNPFPSFPSCHPKLTKISYLPPLRRKPIIYSRTRLLCNSSQSSSSSSSTATEAPPQGYRRNVGICLTNDSKKFLLLQGKIFPVRGKCRISNTASADLETSIKVVAALN